MSIGTMKLLRPCETARSIFDIDYPRLYRAGKRVLLFDLDNTLGGRRPRRLYPQVKELLERITQMGFKVGILTNRRIGTNDPVIHSLGERYPVVVRAGKPRRRGFRAILAQLDASPAEAVMIGDRLLTDVIGANRLGIYSIRIRPGKRA